MTSQAAAHWGIPLGSLTRETGPEFAQLKKDIVAHYGEDKICQSWLQVAALLKQENQRIIQRGSASWPEVDFASLDSLSAEQLDDIKAAGVVIIRNVFSTDQAGEWLSSLDKYLTENASNIPSHPETNPWMYRSYLSPVQNEVRAHPHSLKAQTFLNSLWHGYTPSTALPTPLTYADGLRFRRPGGFASTVKPHIDAGSLERWGDDTYRRYYDGVFSGDVLSHDPYDVTWRNDADTSKYPGRQQSSIFRSFQGWTSLSTSGGGFGKGGLATYPSVRLGVAYVLLRPFFRPPEDGSLDPERWVLDLDSPSFPGAWEGQSQQVSPGLHPHLELDKTLTLTPVVNPGDAVFWHSDVIHAVDPSHEGPGPATVLYIPAVPLNKRNVEYVSRQKKAALNRGGIPPDFTGKDGHVNTGKVEGDCHGYRSIDDIDNLGGRQALGLSKFEGQEEIVQWANEVFASA